MEIGAVNLHPAAPSAAQPPPEEAKAEVRRLVRAVRALNAAEMLGQNQELTFAFDRSTKRPLVRIVDRETGEVVRQIPPEYALRMAEDLRLVDQEAQ
jgi:flagellar protein FlaG